jgi:hypothetical protein
VVRSRFELYCHDLGADDSGRVDKTLQAANLKLGSVLSDIMSANGRAILDVLTQGQTDPERLADQVHTRIRASPRATRRSPARPHLRPPAPAAAHSPRPGRCHRSAERAAIGGTKLDRISPWASRSASHIASFTSVLRPGTFLTCIALASTNSNASARTAQTGFQ